MIYFSYQFLQTQYNKTIEIGDLLYMNSMKKYATMMTLLSLLYSTPYGMAADADSFRTEEYKGMGDNVLALVHAADAYAQGYTGKGVTVGVTDIGIVDFTHPEFAGKDNNTIIYDALHGKYDDLSHPTHVAGILAANKDGAGMHGVAFDAGIASSSAEGNPEEALPLDSAVTFYDPYLTNPDIKIINNSWGFTTYLFAVFDEYAFEYLKADAENNRDVNAITKAVHSDKLLVFAAGNGGHLNPSLDQDLDVLFGDKAFNDHILTVMGTKANSFTEQENGRLEAASDAIALFSDLAMYNEDTAVSAPGWAINSTYADFAASGDYYKSEHGTSMAAPIVSGVGALVQQAFPYLSGKQIGDVLLSTANKNITNDTGYFITEQQDYDYGG